MPVEGEWETEGWCNAKPQGAPLLCEESANQTSHSGAEASGKGLLALCNACAQPLGEAPERSGRGLTDRQKLFSHRTEQSPAVAPNSQSLNGPSPSLHKETCFYKVRKERVLGLERWFNSISAYKQDPYKNLPQR